LNRGFKPNSRSAKIAGSPECLPPDCRQKCSPAQARKYLSPIMLQKKIGAHFAASGGYETQISNPGEASSWQLRLVEMVEY
jgi:hypothetical protein